MSRIQKSKLRTVKAVALATVAAASLIAALNTDARAFQDDGTIILCSIEPLSGIGTSFGQPNYLGKVIAVALAGAFIVIALWAHFTGVRS